MVLVMYQGGYFALLEPNGSPALMDAAEQAKASIQMYLDKAEPAPALEDVRKFRFSIVAVKDPADMNYNVLMGREAIRNIETPTLRLGVLVLRWDAKKAFNRGIPFTPKVRLPRKAGEIGVWEDIGKEKPPRQIYLPNELSNTQKKKILRDAGILIPG